MLEDVSPLFTYAAYSSVTVIAAIGKVGVPSVSGGYGTADTFADDRIDAIRQRTSQGLKDVPLLSKHFSASYRFLRATASMLSAHICYRNSVRPSVRHTGGSVKNG